MSTIILYSIAITALLISFFNDRKKTKRALKKAFKSLTNILPQFLTVLLIVSILLAFFNVETISKYIGEQSGLLGIFSSAIIGSITLIPGFIAFPAAAELLNNGAGVAQIAAFISTLMMVGIATLPLEISFFGKKIALIRNGMAFIFSFAAAAVISWVVLL